MCVYVHARTCRSWENDAGDDHLDDHSSSAVISTWAELNSTIRDGQCGRDGKPVKEP